MTAKLRSKGLILILSAPSGGGKSSPAKKLLELDSNLRLVISATTRKPRGLEQEGVEYFFKTDAEFEALVDENMLIEYAQIYNHYYGTPKDKVEEYLNDGHDVIFDIDWQGARSIRRQQNMQVVTVFILPPSIDILRERLRLRDRDSSEEIALRIDSINTELEYIYEYDYVIINDDFEESARQIRTILTAEKNKTSKLDKSNEFIEQK